MANEFVAHGLMYSNGEHSPAHIPTKQKLQKFPAYHASLPITYATN
jgi:hypothetical protein